MRFRVILVIVGALILSGTVSGEEALQRFRAEEANAQASPPLAGGAGNTPTNRDFLSLFIAALESYSDSGGEAITLDYNLPDAVFGKSLASKAQLVLRKPSLNEKLAKDFAEKTDILKALENELSYGDDVTLTFAISPQAKQGEANVQKAFEASASRLLTWRKQELLQERAAARADSSRARVRNRAGLAGGAETVAETTPGWGALDAALRRENTSGNGGVPPAGPEAAPVDPNAPVDNTVDGPVTNTTTPDFVDVAVNEQAAQTLVDDMAALAANQSKFTLDASYRDRRDVVGPDEWAVKVAYEHGFGTNVGQRMARTESTCMESYARAEAMSAEAGCANVYETALREAVQDPMVAMGSRMTFALEYHDKSGVNIDRTVDVGQAPDPTLKFNSDGARSLVASLAAGRDVFITNKENKRERSGRLELTLSYDDVSDDKERNDRFIGKLTYSQRINDKLFLPVSITYANHAEYLGEVNHKLNAHFGIANKLPDTK